MNRYQVKFPWGGDTLYGIVYKSELDKVGRVEVDEALTGDRYMVPEQDLTDIPVEYGRLNMKTVEWEGQDEYQQFLVNSLKEAEKAAGKLGPGVRVGKLFAVGVADGSACYIVTEVKGKRCTIEWRGYHPDRWTDQLLGWGGEFDVSMIAPQVKASDARRKHWAELKAERMA